MLSLNGVSVYDAYSVRHGEQSSSLIYQLHLIPTRLVPNITTVHKPRFNHHRSANNRITLVGFEVLTAWSMKITIY
jgi:hypothetical protein